MSTTRKIPACPTAQTALGQQALPFLDPDDAATIDAACAAVDRAQAAALTARRWAEADELGRLGTQLVGILHRNAERARAAHTTRNGVVS